MYLAYYDPRISSLTMTPLSVFPNKLQDATGWLSTVLYMAVDTSEISWKVDG